MSWIRLGISTEQHRKAEEKNRKPGLVYCQHKQNFKATKTLDTYSYAVKK